MKKSKWLPFCVETIKLEEQSEELDIEIFHSPSEYLEILLTKIKTAQNRIILSALYFGKGENCETLLREIKLALNDLSRPELKVVFILDHSRAHRSDDNTIRRLEPLVSIYPNRCSVHFYQMPQLRSYSNSTSLTSFSRWITPYWLREIIAVYHCKYFIFDNDVILSGANLSEEYLCNRQDRYFLFKKVAFKLVKDENFIDDRNKLKILSCLLRFTDAMTKLSYSIEPRPMKQNNSFSAKYSLRNPSLQLSISQESKLLQNAFIIDRNPPTEQTDVYKTRNMVTFMPMVQHNYIGINEEEKIISEVFENANTYLSDNGSVSSNKLVSLLLSTPYANFSQSFSSKISKLNYKIKTADIKILTAFDKSHGFAGSRGIKSLVPLFHKYSIETSFEEKASNSSAERLQLLNYQRDNWTFHAKGLWLKLKDQVGENGALVYIGSSNFGERSWKRDFELGFLIKTWRKSDIRAFEKETSLLCSNAYTEKIKHTFSNSYRSRIFDLLFRFSKSYL